MRSSVPGIANIRQRQSSQNASLVTNAPAQEPLGPPGGIDEAPTLPKTLEHTKVESVQGIPHACGQSLSPIKVMILCHVVHDVRSPRPHTCGIHHFGSSPMVGSTNRAYDRQACATCGRMTLPTNLCICSSRQNVCSGAVGRSPKHGVVGIPRNGGRM